MYDAQEPSEESKQLVALFHDLESRQLDFLMRRPKASLSASPPFSPFYSG